MQHWKTLVLNFRTLWLSLNKNIIQLTAERILAEALAKKAKGVIGKKPNEELLEKYRNLIEIKYNDSLSNYQVNTTKLTNEEFTEIKNRINTKLIDKILKDEFDKLQTTFNNFNKQ